MASSDLWTYKPEAAAGQKQLKVAQKKPAGEACNECPLQKNLCVFPERHPGAKIAIVGESPGPSELVEGRPFVGPSGRLLNHLNKKIGLKREDVHWTNAVLCQGKESELGAARKACQARLDAELTSAKVQHVFALGGHALHATAHTSRKPRIQHYRGSIMFYENRTIFPMVHPAFVIRAKQWEPVMLTDFLRAQRIMADGFRLPERMHGRTMRVPQTLAALKAELQPMGKVVGVDIETTGLDATETSLVCLGISDGQRTVVIPWSRDKRGTCCFYGLQGQRQVADYLTEFFSTRTGVTHNGPMFDQIVLERYGIKFDKWEDTLLAHHSFASHMPRRLSHVVTMYEDVTPWKDEKHADKMREYYRYNGRDTLYTKLAWDHMQPDLAEEMPVYEQDKISAMLCKGMQVTGFRFDRDKARMLKRKLRRVERVVRRQANEMMGREINLMSQTQLRHAFFEELGAPVFFRSEKTNKPALNVNALRAYAALGNMSVARRVSDLDKLNRLSNFVLTLRKARKARSTYIDAIVTDSGGRVHPVWQSYGAVSGRFSCVAKGTLVETMRDVSKYPKGVPIEKVRPGDYAYCYIDGKLALRQVTWAGCTGVKNVVRVRWRGTGNQHVGHVDLTADHRVLLTSGEWCAAGELRHGDKVMALARDIAGFGYSRLYATGAGAPVSDHRFVYNQFTGDWPEDVHHEGHKLDNRFHMLTGMSRSEHCRHHGTSDELRRKRSENARRLNREGRIGGSAPGQLKLKLTKAKIVRELRAHQWATTRTARALGHDFATFKAYVIRAGLDPEELKRRNRRIRIKPLRARAAVARALRWPKGASNNHTVLSVTPLRKRVRVYDLSVEEAHNFIANEICVHNCARPNIMNLPRFENDPVAEFGGIRSLYFAAPGKVLVAFDFSQLEMRIAAYVSGDEVMIAACESSDLHASNAGIIFGQDFLKLDKKKDEDEYKKLRNLAKQSGFAVAYMAGAPTVYARIIAAGIPITLLQTEQMLRNMRRAFKGYYAYQEDLLLQTIRIGHVRIPISNRLRWLGHAPKPPECANTPIQGGASGLMNLVLPAIERQLPPDTFLVAQVHDAAYFETPVKRADEILALCKQETSRPFEINGRRVVFPTDMKVGERWSDL